MKELEIEEQVNTEQSKDVPKLEPLSSPDTELSNSGPLQNGAQTYNGNINY